MSEEAGPAEFHISSGFGMRTRRPFVLVRVSASAEIEVQMRPADALQISDQLRGAAYAALGDAALSELMGGEALTSDEVGEMLRRLREARAGVDEREDMGVR